MSPHLPLSLPAVSQRALVHRASPDSCGCGQLWRRLGPGALMSGLKTKTVFPGCQPEPSGFPLFTCTPLVMTDIQKGRLTVSRPRAPGAWRAAWKHGFSWGVGAPTQRQPPMGPDVPHLSAPAPPHVPISVSFLCPLCSRVWAQVSWVPGGVFRSPRFYRLNYFQGKEPVFLEILANSQTIAPS